LDDYFLIGEIKSNYDDEGFVVIDSFSDFIDRFFDLKFVFIKIYGVEKKLFVDAVKIIDGSIVMRFKNFISLKDTEPLIGLKLFVDEENVVSLDDDTFFVHDLLGCKVYYADKFFGDVVDVLKLESNDVYVIHDSKKEEHLIPAVRDYIKSIDINTKRIELISDWETMFYDED
jgi:16S rRNA processing protein RimM